MANNCHAKPLINFIRYHLWTTDTVQIPYAKKLNITFTLYQISELGND